MKEEVIKIIEKLEDKVEEGNSRWTKKYDDADFTSKTEMEAYQWALNDVKEKINKIE